MTNPDGKNHLMINRLSLITLSLALLASLILAGCSTAEANFAPGTAFTRSSPLIVQDSTDTGKAIEAELLAKGFNVFASGAKDATAPAGQTFIARLVVRRSWRGVVTGVVPGTITLTIADARTGAVAATASYDLGSMSYNSTRDAAKAVVAALAAKVR
jgi:hypothetical protein